MINKVTLIGNIGRDPEVRSLESGAMVANFSLATNESYKDKNGEWQTITEWHNIVAWRGLAEKAERSLKKGNLVYIEGKITSKKWQDKEGNERYNTDIVAQILKPLERRNNNDSYVGQLSADDEKAFPKFDTDLQVEKSQDLKVSEDDLPF